MSRAWWQRKLCRAVGHDWQDVPLRYEYSTTKAYVGNDHEPREVPVAWVNDEVCGRCGAESWWPS